MIVFIYITLIFFSSSSSSRAPRVRLCKCIVHVYVYASVAKNEREMCRALHNTEYRDEDVACAARSTDAQSSFSRMKSNSAWRGTNVTHAIGAHLCGIQKVFMGGSSFRSEGAQMYTRACLVKDESEFVYGALGVCVSSGEHINTERARARGNKRAFTFSCSIVAVNNQR